jgi:ATP-dependent DNA helicase RecG
VRQSGVPLLRIADLERDADLLDVAREVAETLLRDYPQAAEAHLKRWLRRAEEYVKV